MNNKATKVFSIESQCGNGELVIRTTYVRLDRPMSNQSVDVGDIVKIVLAAECPPAEYNGPGQWFIESPVLKWYNRRVIVTQIGGVAK